MGFFRVMINGKSPATAEVWSVGTSWIGPNPAIPFDDLLAWATGIGTAIMASTGNGLIAILSSTGSINEIRVEQRDETDESLMQAAEYVLTTPETGAGSPSKVLQTAVVISLLTAQPGRSYRGRCYWPAWSYTGTADMLFSQANLATWLNGFRDIVNLIRAQAIVVDPAYAMALAVRSRLLHESHQVLTIAAGTVPDTQRRRRDAVPETYVSQTL